jgi:hypothetical protein
VRTLELFSCAWLAGMAIACGGNLSTPTDSDGDAGSAGSEDGGRAAAETGGASGAGGSMSPVVSGMQSPGGSTSGPSGPVPPMGSDPGQAPSTPLPPTAGPLECGAETEKVSDTFCERRLPCRSTELVVACRADADDNWQCDCTGALDAEEYVLRGAGDATSACKLAMGLCRDEEEPESDVDCSVQMSSGNRTRCERAQNCTHTAELDAGLVAEVSALQLVACEQVDAGLIECTCATNGSVRLYEVARDDVEASCEDALTWCAGPKPEFSDEPSCEPMFQGSGDSCDLSLRCRRAESVGADATAVQIESRSSSCALDGDAWVCSCQSDVRALEFELLEASGGAQTCETAIDVCSPDLELESQGALACSRSSYDQGAGYCNAQIACEQPVAAGEERLVARRAVHVTCIEGDESSWSCACDSGFDSATLEMTGDEPCVEAIEACPEELGIAL